MMKVLGLAFALVVLLATPSWAGRSFAGGAATDVITTGTIASTTARTVCFWFYMNAWDGSSARRFVNHVNGANTITDIRGDTTGNLSSVAGWTGTDGQWNVAEPSTGAWHHLCWTYDGSSGANDPIYYLDGATPSVTETAAPATAPLDSGTVAYVFGNVAAGNRAINGKLAEIAVWTSAISAGNAALLYNSGLGARADTISPAPSHYWPLCGTASPEPDVVGGSNGTVTGATATDHPFNNCGLSGAGSALTRGVGQ